ncbi:MAG: hypothetical protein JEZ08_15740 [Clostridiales bacterium]|nr:hypothetical protein [Clostridiales bacterium]
MNFFSISALVVDREDLTIYEKMCCVVLARFFQDETLEDITMEQLSKHMGVEEIVAKGAFYSLRSKGILESLETDVKPGTIIKAEEVQAVPEAPENEIILTNDQKVLKVFEIIDEKINDREAKIILSFAGNDLDKIRDKYKVAKASQFQDKIEVLIHELQKKEHGRIIKKEEIAEKEKSINEFVFEEEVQNTQINTYKINLMKKYAKK